MGGSQAGCVGLLTLCSIGMKPIRVIPFGDMFSSLACELGIPNKYVPFFDLIVSVHSRSIIPKELLQAIKHGGINVHPCLYAYKGADPVGRLLADGNTRASVGVHRMTDKVDEGEVLVEEFVGVTGCKTRDEVYNKLYPYYSIALIKAMRMIA